MKKLVFIIGLLISLQGYSQNGNLSGIDLQEEKYDTISCEHFIQAHEIVRRNGTQRFAHVVDYPILQYIRDTKQCDNLSEHAIHVDDLKYFIFTILTIPVDPN